ncbi:MAG: DNA polymerase III subunit delta [Balneolaceae bacterium]
MARPTSIDIYKNALSVIRSPEKRKPVLYLYGEETFFIDRLQDELEKLVPPEQRDFNFDLLYGLETTPGKILDIARSFPMMAEQRVVIVREFLKAGENVSEGEGHLNDFESYLNKPNPQTVLCLIDDKHPDKRMTLGKALNKKGGEAAVFKFDFLPDYKLADWVTEWVAHKHNKKMDARAAQVLSQLVGNNLQLLSIEIDKVCTFVDTESEINIDHVKKIIGSYREYSAIELKDALISRDLEKSLGIAEQMLLKGNAEAGEVIRTVGFFYSVFGNIWQIRRLAEKGLGKQQVQNELGITNNWIFNRQWQDASNFSLAEMPGIFEALLDADRAAKGYTTLDTSSILLLLITRIAG